MTRFNVSLPLLALVLASAGSASATAVGNPVVPAAVQARIAHQAPGLAYVPTRVALGFHYRNWQKTPSTVRIAFENRAGSEITFISSRLTGACRAGVEKSFQLDGNKVYWSHTGVEQRAWRCVSGRDGRRVRLVASSRLPPTRFAAVGLGRVVASGKPVAV